MALPSYKFYGGNVVGVYVRFFFFLILLIFTLLVASISPFLTAAIEFSCFSRSNEIGLFFISRSSSFAVINVNVDIKIKFRGKNQKSG